LRSIRMTGFMDTLRLQTVPPGTPVPRPIPPPSVEPPPVVPPPVPGTDFVTTGMSAAPLEHVTGDDLADVTVGP
jgi:hypothetical protein